MLTQDEEAKLDNFLEFIKEFPPLNDGDVMWLAKKLKLINDECSQVHAELQKANEELARVYEVLER